MAAEFSITRSAVLRAPAPAVFAQIEDFRAWTAWSPWDADVAGTGVFVSCGGAQPKRPET